MPEKQSIFSQLISEWASVAYVICVSSGAGAVGYLNRIRRRITDFTWGHLAINFFVGGLNGYLVFLMCDAADWSWQTTAFLTGAAGAMGSELLNGILSKVSSTILPKEIHK